MSRQSRTFDSIMSYVNEFISKEGVNPTADFVRLLADQALSEISEAAGAIRTSWSNATGGDLTLTGNSAPLPADCLLITSVEWDGSDNPIDRSCVSKWDYETPGWRAESGDPSEWTIDGANIVLNAEPSGTVTGKLVARGFGMLGAFSDAAGAANPLDSLPIPRQLSIAKYVVGYYPVIQKEPRTDTPAAYHSADLENARRQQVRADHLAMWELEKIACIDWVRGRQFEEFSY